MHTRPDHGSAPFSDLPSPASCDATPYRDASICTLMRLMASGRSAADLFASANAIDDSASMLMQMAMLLTLSGNDELAWTFQENAIRLRPHYRLAADRQPASLRLLVIAKPGFMLDNTPVEFLLEGSDVAMDVVYVALDLPLPDRLPDHDLVFVAIAQFVRHRALFEKIGPLIRGLTTPVLNMPGPLFGVERDRLSTLLQGIDGLRVPPCRQIDRAVLQGIAGDSQVPAAAVHGTIGFPAIVRPLISSGGLGLARINDCSEAMAYLLLHADAAFYVAPFVDYRSADGLYRKCRIALLQGRAFVCHLAISEHWMVHYQSAGMERSAARREEEAHFMRHFDTGFGRRHARALSIMWARLGLDYVVVDCAELQDGQLLFFEADNISVVHAMDSAEMFPYKQEQMQKVQQAFRQLLDSAVSSGTI
ncbi:RimK family alpha-L-glutamate ligase [Herbaspirillum sp. RV1423]|uniref:ATP-grasp domain-containing protein n=1 Tax=Herbaspirillum sp. RV1423 TaxID=1443993 RepID=UPI0018CBFD52|nr:RimK family alpha-L-glutamate ligase [Herbaspirillum sp. RV1423]